MSSQLFEIIQLPNGTYALRRADGKGEALVTIQFSDEARQYLGDSSIDVAKAMIDSGIELVEEMVKTTPEFGEDLMREEDNRTIH